MSWPASRAFSSWGSTVSSKPSTPSTRGRPRGDAGRGVAAELLVDGRRLPPRRAQLAEGGGKVGRGVGRDGGAHGGEPRPRAASRRQRPAPTARPREVLARRRYPSEVRQDDRRPSARVPLIAHQVER